MGRHRIDSDLERGMVTFTTAFVPIGLELFQIELKPMEVAGLAEQDLEDVLKDLEDEPEVTLDPIQQDLLVRHENPDLQFSRPKRRQRSSRRSSTQ